MKPHYDPYDLWSQPVLGHIKEKALMRSWPGLALAATFTVLETGFPILMRRLFGVPRHSFAHVVAMGVMSCDVSEPVGARSALDYFKREATWERGYMAWGLPFAWFSKNGRYPADIPYVTNTPYVMEALLYLAKQPAFKDEAFECFEQTWGFLEDLRVVHQADGLLALSYAPLEEPRLVVNANSYAAYAYALHAIHATHEERRVYAEKRAREILRWVVSMQSDDGHWTYYADELPGNFVDCFHSCFILKNLIKLSRLLPALAEEAQPSIARGWAFLRGNFLDARKGLCRRFSKPKRTDLHRWDLYDQAEYLGLLVDFGYIAEAVEFREHVERYFFSGANWYCRIDILGRRWGRDFLRWGIAPFLYQSNRLNEALSG